MPLASLVQLGHTTMQRRFIIARFATHAAQGSAMALLLRTRLCAAQSIRYTRVFSHSNILRCHSHLVDVRS
jgi:hypothetical protein